MVLLRQLIITQDFNNRLKCLNDKVKDNFRFWQAHSPHYTDHGECHCEALEKNLDELIPQNVRSTFNEYEGFLLLCGVLLHDIGIMCACSSTEENEKIRANHHERSRNFVLNHLEDLLNPSERYIVGEICYAHRDSIPIKKIEKTKRIRHPSLGNQTVRVQFLAALVRVADTFDLCHTRTSDRLDDLIKFPPEAAFFHALHERLSGVDFDKDRQSVFLDFNVSSNDEKKICVKYVVHDAQRALDSVRDCLISNNIVYTTVVPKFSLTNAVQSKLQVPRKIKAKQLEPNIPTELEALKAKAWKAFSAQEFDQSLDFCNKGLAINDKESILLYLKARVSEIQGDLPQATEFYEKCIDSDPKDIVWLNAAGNFFGETLLDITKSFEYFEKAYKIIPDDDLILLNYSESLVTIDRFQEAFDLVTKYWVDCNDLFKAINAKFIEAYSLIFMGKKDEGFKQLAVFYYLLKSSPYKDKKTIWRYDKLSKYIKQSSIESSLKDMLLDTINLMNQKMSYDAFQKKYNIAKFYED